MPEAINFLIFFSAWIRPCYPGVFKKMAKDKNLLHYFIIPHLHLKEKFKLNTFHTLLNSQN